MVGQKFTRKKVASRTLGEKLQQLREENRLGTKGLSRKIHVKESYIIALEKGAYEDLPTKVYTKGYIRSYARFFGVQEQVLLNSFEKEYSVYTNISHKDQEETVNKLPHVPRFIVTPRVIFGFIGVVFLLGIGVYLYFGIDNFVSAPWLFVEEPLNGHVVHADVVTVRGKTRSNTHVSINGQEVFVDIDGKFAHELHLAHGLNTITVHSVNQFDKETTKEVVIDAQYAREEPKPDKKTVHLFVKAHKKPVWIDVEVDGHRVFNETITPDDEQPRTFDAIDAIVLTASSGMHTHISIDGETYAPLDKTPDIVQKKTFDKDVIAQMRESDDAEKTDTDAAPVTD